ncbi:MAG: hypothetical protein A3I11_08205 [Elusimicrobia bacterium RIFCSPLOWO2_02_FULL_39_32]|nr:MAG: hypothetical protein A2034_05790 [Elusimicrobia bacterium GWA2_38_7]OGR79253.1 MAG: hypothetical protein A3B80_08465 [Elusimicrobia bacterium RIFCSPHIGHO2_02_FULL_39_36]OGR93154.1 MAG: hypothetical protein A3I11_08205 [Elusimicrobia bacterium RIFCSPLOWO2_02_FULL_39_32]OGR99379.1 MAG: hypothetical protein A3G85_06650 [Elusimicrobia bacterium RIFCSPLOWO2_12_FULL_39_28]
MEDNEKVKNSPLSVLRNKKLKIYADGASRGNPGPASYGICVLDSNDKILLEIGETIGNNTNSVAEYSALIRSLEEAVKLGAEELEIFTDSQLVARQFEGVYRVKDENLKILMQKVRELEKKFKSVNVQHILRSSHPGNVRADRLANIALNRSLK